MWNPISCFIDGYMLFGTDCKPLSCPIWFGLDSKFYIVRSIVRVVFYIPFILLEVVNVVFAPIENMYI